MDKTDKHSDSESMRFIAAGSAMYTRRVSVSKNDRFLDLVKLIRSCDVGFMNMEGLIRDMAAYPLKPYSFASYFNGESWLAEEYKWTGFNMCSLANNHTTDWSPEAMYTTERLLDAAGIVHAGTGVNLTAARQPAFFDTPKGRVSLISIDSSYEYHEFAQVQMASEPRGSVPGRPGMNGIRFDCYYEVDEQTLADLRSIQRKLGLRMPTVNKEIDNETDLFFSNGGAPGIRFKLGTEVGFHTKAFPQDVDANLRWVKSAVAMSDHVLVTHHTHALGDHKSGPFAPVPAQFVSDFAHACIDAGATAYLGHGMHGKGVEIYKGKPIFYDLGWFSWQVETLTRIPSDGYENWGLDAQATPTDFAKARPGGGFGSAGFFDGVLSEFTMKGDKLVGVILHPITMGRDLPVWQHGLPMLATGTTAKAIIERYQKMSEPFGTRIDYENGVGVIRL